MSTLSGEHVFRCAEEDVSAGRGGEPHRFAHVVFFFSLSLSLSLALSASAWSHVASPPVDPPARLQIHHQPAAPRGPLAPVSSAISPGSLEPCVDGAAVGARPVDGGGLGAYLLQSFCTHQLREVSMPGSQIREIRCLLESNVNVSYS